MKKILTFIALFLIFVSFPNISAQEATGEPIILEQLVSTEPSTLGFVDVNVKLEWPEIYPNELSTFKVSFHDPITDELIHTNTRFDYTVMVKQNDHIIEEYYEETIKGGHEYNVMFPEDSEGPAEVTVLLHFIRTDYDVLRLDEEITFSVNVVPEFGVIAGIILATAFIPILLASKSKLVIR